MTSPKYPLETKSLTTTDIEIFDAFKRMLLHIIIGPVYERGIDNEFSQGRRKRDNNGIYKYPSVK